MKKWCFAACIMVALLSGCVQESGAVLEESLGAQPSETTEVSGTSSKYFTQYDNIQSYLELQGVESSADMVAAIADTCMLDDVSLADVDLLEYDRFMVIRLALPERNADQDQEYHVFENDTYKGFFSINRFAQVDSITFQQYGEIVWMTIVAFDADGFGGRMPFLRGVERWYEISSPDLENVWTYTYTQYVGNVILNSNVYYAVDGIESFIEPDEIGQDVFRVQMNWSERVVWQGYEVDMEFGMSKNTIYEYDEETKSFFPITPADNEIHNELGNSRIGYDLVEMYHDEVMNIVNHGTDDEKLWLAKYLIFYVVKEGFEDLQQWGFDTVTASDINEEFCHWSDNTEILNDMYLFEEGL